MKSQKTEHPAVRVTRLYKSKEFMSHARKQLAKDPLQAALLG